MHWKTSALFVAALILAGFSYLATTGEGKEKGGGKDKKALQGTWTGSKGDKKAQLTFEGNKFMLELGGKSASGTFTIDPAKKPKQIDMTVTKGSDEDTKKYEGKTSKGIYELEGDKLKWLAAEPGAEDRPEAFPNDPAKVKGLYLILERAKK
jgi:uncharacterized protein (TIGR03067 family)